MKGVLSMPDITKQLVAVAIIATLGACGGSKSADAVNNKTAGNAEQQQPASKKAANPNPYSAGTLNAMVNGVPHSWYVDPQMSSWERWPDGKTVDVMIFARSMPDNQFTGNLEISVRGSEDKLFADEIYSFRGKKDVHNFSTKNNGSGNFKSTEFKVTDNTMHITGTFAAAMPAVAQAGGEPDMSNILAIKDGTFDVAVPPEED